MVGKERTDWAESGQEITNHAVQCPSSGLVLVVESRLHHLKIVARKETRAEGFERLRGGVNVQIRPCSLHLAHRLLEFSQNPPVLWCKVFGCRIQIFGHIKLGGKSSDVEQFGQHAEILLLNFFRVDVKIIADLSITRLP